ncbi:MAG: phosphotransferase, partial [Candidatus Rokubacteria bacterium]|nr:phosphotransferase [Candidatus Rokubacteria bacterium]
VMPAGFTREALAAYLAGVLGAGVEVLAVRALGAGQPVDPKAFGYGLPFEVEVRVGGAVRRVVVARTRPAQGFGHDYAADRAWQALYGHAAYNSFPRHVRSLDVGFVSAGGALVSAGGATEFFQVVEKAEGTLYRLDLERMLTEPATPLDVERAETLARFLAAAHAVRRDEPTLYQRRIRELVGHGECVMGILDSYPHPYPLLPPAACEALERMMVTWRWRLRGRAHRLARTHGDFHPWNLLFRDGTDFSVLDRSRGEWGEPADDVSALAINYLFFGLRRSARERRSGIAEPFATLFRRFLAAYAAASGDAELADVLPPFLAFRALVIAHPRWYPALDDATRKSLLGFARRMAASARFDADGIPALAATSAA